MTIDDEPRRPSTLNSEEKQRQLATRTIVASMAVVPAMFWNRRPHLNGQN